MTVPATAEIYTVVADGKHYAVATDWRPHEIVVRARINGDPISVQLESLPLSWRLASGGRVAEARILTPRAAELLRLIPEKEPPDMSRFLLSPMPGLLVRLNVQVGDEVKAGQELAVVEAMKMENSLRAEQNGIVAKCLVEPNQNLVAEQPIIEFE
jgi:propionyl-CoA carboxylase alpha chain